MTSSDKTSRSTPGPVFALGRSVIRWLGSLQLAVLVLGVLAVVLALATGLELEYALWHVYQSPWFMSLVGLLALNIFMATVLRYPWGWGRAGFLLTHIGLLMLLMGAMQTFRGGIEGTLSIQEGESADTLMKRDRSRFSVRWRSGQDKDSGSLYSFSFRAGPEDWREGKQLDLKYQGDVGLRVLKYYRHANVEEGWVADTSDKGRPALQLGIVGGDGRSLGSHWLSADLFGDQVNLGPTKVEYQRVGADSMLEDILKPPAADIDKEGVLSVHSEGGVKRLPVSTSRGKKIPIGDGKTFVEIADYLPNAKPTEKLDFESRGDGAANPALKIFVHLPGKDAPMRQTAFAQTPLLSPDAIHGTPSPVKFWYHHPAIAPQPGIQFLQFPNGKLYCRVSKSGKWETPAVVVKGDSIPFAAGFKIRVAENLPQASHEVRFYASDPRSADGEENREESATLVEVDAGGITQQVWLLRGSRQYSDRDLTTPEGNLRISFGYDQMVLGFSLKLVRFERTRNPGGMGNAGFTSVVRLVDRAAGVNEERVISMNQPLKHGKYVFYQSGFDEPPDGAARTILSVSHDPGWILKYAGSSILCVGIALVMWMQMILSLVKSLVMWMQTGKWPGKANGKRTARPPTPETAP